MHSEDERSLSRIIDVLTRCDGPRNASQQILQAVCELAKMRGGNFVEMAPLYTERKLVDVAWSESYSIAEFDRLHLEYLWENPVLPVMREIKGNVFRHAEIVGEKAWFESGIVTKCLEKFDLRDALAINFRGSTGAVRWAIFGGSHLRNGFKPQIRELLNQLAPVISNGLHNVEAWQAWLDHAHSLEVALSHSQELILLVKPASERRSAKVLTQTRAAQRAVHANLPDARNTALKELLRLAPHACGVKSGTLAWTAHDGRRFLVSSSYVADRPLTNGENARADCASNLLVRLWALSSTAASDTAGQLSQRERDVFKLLERGHSNKEIAHLLELALSTVNTHIQSIYRKLNVNSRVEAINALAPRR